MKIHTVNEGETLSDVAKKYGVCESDLSEINGIIGNKLSAGEEILILVPTRVHTSRYGDTLEKICMRYRVRINDILTLNPTIDKRKLEANKRIILKYDTRTHGMAVTNGCIYKGTTLNALENVLPLMTYATFASVMADQRGFHKIFDEECLLNTVKKESKVPILKIHDSWNERYSNLGNVTEFCDDIIELARKKGYKGILLNSTAHSCSASDYISFMMNLKKRMIGSDLILFTECDEKTPSGFNEIADGSILSYTKLWNEKICSFSEGEKKIISDFACDSESIKSFIELPSFARLGDGFIDIESAKRKARNKETNTVCDDETLTASFDTGHKKCIYPTLKNVKAVLELMSEYGFMGICFDVMRTPSVFLSMYNAMFKTVNYTTSASREGCSRE